MDDHPKFKDQNNEPWVFWDDSKKIEPLDIFKIPDKNTLINSNLSWRLEKQKLTL